MLLKQEWSLFVQKEIMARRVRTHLPGPLIFFLASLGFNKAAVLSSRLGIDLELRIICEFDCFDVHGSNF